MIVEKKHKGVTLVGYGGIYFPAIHSEDKLVKVHVKDVKTKYFTCTIGESSQARNYFREKNYESAKGEFEKVLDLESEHPGAQWYLMYVKQELGKKKKTFWNCMEGLKCFDEKKKTKGKKVFL